MDALRDPQEWLSLDKQRRAALHLVTRHELLDLARYYAALTNLVRQEDFRIVLEQLCQRLVLTSRAQALRHALAPELHPQGGGVKQEDAALYRLGREDAYRELLEEVRLAPEHSATLAAKANTL